jgi:hypothetical protein
MREDVDHRERRERARLQRQRFDRAIVYGGPVDDATASTSRSALSSMPSMSAMPWARADLDERACAASDVEPFAGGAKRFASST